MSGPAPTERQDFTTNPGAAVKHFTEEASARIGDVETDVKKLGDRIEASEGRFTEAAENLQTHAQRFEDLKAGEKFATLGEQLENLQTQGARLEQFASRSAPGPQHSGFVQANLEAENLKAYRESNPRQGRAVVVVPSFNARRFAAGRFTADPVSVDSGQVGVLAEDFRRPGIVTALEDPIGLVDVVNYVPPMSSGDTYVWYSEDSEGRYGAMAMKAAETVAGGTTAVATIDVNDATWCVPGTTIYFHVASGLHGLVLTSKDGNELTFPTDAIDFDVATGDTLSSEEYLSTGEGLPKPPGTMKASENSKNLQTIAAWKELTRQRLLRTSVVNLAQWAEQKLRAEHRTNLEWHLLYGSGSSGELDGFLNTSGIGTNAWSTSGTGATRADAVILTACDIPGSEQIVAVMHKKDWTRLTLAKNGEGDYVHTIAGGPRIIDTPAVKAISGIQVVLPRNIPESTVLVFAPEPASDVVPANDAQLSWGYINEQFTNNQITALYEESLLNAVKDITAIRKLTLDAAPS